MGTDTRVLSAGRYWMVESREGSRRRTRVVLKRERGVAWVYHATDAWRVDRGSRQRLDEFSEDTRFEPVRTKMQLEIDDQSQATGKELRDVHGCSLRPGKYSLRRPGIKGEQLVELYEDDLNFDLWFDVQIDGQNKRQRVDELAGDVIFERL